MSNTCIITMAATGDLAARRERLTRNIMAVDECDWDEANGTVEQICVENAANSGMMKLPYQIGIAAGIGSGAISLPMVFDEKLVRLVSLVCVYRDKSR